MLRSAPRREPAQNFPTTHERRTQTKLSSSAANLKRNRVERVHGLVPPREVERKLCRMPVFKPPELFVLLPTFFQTAPEISPCLQVPNAARSRETTRDVRQKLKAVLPSRAARERSRRAERAESVSIWATGGGGFWK